MVQENDFCDIGFLPVTDYQLPVSRNSTGNSQLVTSNWQLATPFPLIIS